MRIHVGSSDYKELKRIFSFELLFNVVNYRPWRDY